ncbi:MAG: sugar phosphate isomerase/epimerase family protein [Planctomycetota bacterium]
MTKALDRRRFVQGGLAAAWALGVVASNAAAPQLADAIEPIKRPGAAKFKFSLAAYSYRDLLSGKNMRLTMADFVRECARFGLDGTELTSYYFPKELTKEYLLSIKKLCFELGLDISGTAVGNDFGHPEGEKRRQQVELVKRWVDHAAVLGAPVIRVFAGHAQPGSTPAEAHRLLVAGLEECCDYAGQQGVFLALENHGGPTATAAGLLEFVRDVKSPWFGVNVDTGNFHSQDIYAELEQVAPYALNVQVKVVVTGADGKKQPSDYARLAKMLRAVGYRGYIVLEYEEPGDPPVECAKHLESLRAAFA